SRHTRFSRDWSSDVCSSDLVQVGLVAAAQVDRLQRSESSALGLEGAADGGDDEAGHGAGVYAAQQFESGADGVGAGGEALVREGIGRASGREGGWVGVVDAR